MTISFVDATSAEATSLTMPTHQAGDLLLFFAYRRANNTVPTLPSGWKFLTSAFGSNNAFIVGWCVASSSSITSGTWTNAEMVACGVWRSSDEVIAPGGYVSITGATTTITWLDYSTSNNQERNSGNTWHVAMIGHREHNADINTPPTGMTNREYLTGASTTAIAIHDTNADYNWSASSQTTVTSGVSRGVVIELCKTGYTPGGGASSRPILPFIQQVIG